MYQSLRCNLKLKMMARSDQKVLMLDVFKKNNLATNDPHVVKALLPEYEGRALSRGEREIQVDNHQHAETKGTISLLISLET